MASAARAQTPVRVTFPSADRPGIAIDGYLFRPATESRAPALVFMHGCAGLLSREGMDPRLEDWASRFVAEGYVVLAVDSFTPRRLTNLCAPGDAVPGIYGTRSGDAVGALSYLKRQPFVDGERVALFGWSQGGGAVLSTLARERGFRAAVAFYPGHCYEEGEGSRWTTTTPLLVLIGGSDNWTPAERCASLLFHRAARNAPIELHVYPGAYHDFDWPNLALRSLPLYGPAHGPAPIVGENPAAHADAVTRIRAFLKRVLQPAS